MMPTKFYQYQKAIREVVRRAELGTILSRIEDDKYLPEEDKKELRYGIYLRMRYTY